MKYIEFAINTVLTVLLLDGIAFSFWVASGQVPTDGFYAGAISANIIRILFGV